MSWEAVGRCPHCGEPLDEGAAVELTDGEDAARRPWWRHGVPRRVALLAAVVAVVLAAAFAVTQAGSGDGDGSGQADTAGMTTSEPAVTLTPTTVIRGEAPLLDEPTGLALLVFNSTGGRPERIELDTGRVSEPEMLVGDAGSPLAVEGAVVVAGRDGVWLFGPGAPRGGTQIAPEPAQGGLATLNRNLFASDDPGRVWVFAHNDTTQVLHELTLDGTVTAGPYEIGLGVVGIVADGVIVNRPHSGAVLFDPDAGTGSPVGGQVLAIHDDRVARYRCAADLSCGLWIGSLDRIGRHLSDLERPTQSVRFSADGGTLALASLSRQGHPLGREVVLLDAATGDEVVRVPAGGRRSGVLAARDDWFFLTQEDAILAVHQSGTPVLEVETDIAEPRAILVLDENAWPH